MRYKEAPACVQVVAVGRRKYFYIVNLAQSKVERIRTIMGCTPRCCLAAYHFCSVCARQSPSLGGPSSTRNAVIGRHALASPESW